MLEGLENKNETNNNNLSLDFDIQRYVDVDISDSNLYRQEFSIRDAIPISLNLESFIFIKTHCIHNIFHIFKLPIKTEIKWKIKGGIANGAFKIGYGMDAEYFPRDSGDSVILYPQLQNNNNDNNNNDNDNNKKFKNTKIFLELSVKQLDSSNSKEQEYQFLVTVDIFILRKFAKQTFRTKMIVRRIDNQNDTNNPRSNYINNHNSNIDFNSSNLISPTTTTTKLEKTEVRKKEGNDLLFKSLNNCKICNLLITAFNTTNNNNNNNNNTSPLSINLLKSYLITSDVIKVSAENYSVKNITNNNSLIITGSNYKKYSINGIQIQPRLFWRSNIGKIVSGNLCQSMIYYTPGESDLSKSPITLNLYFQYDHSKNDIQQATLSDNKKLWMLRQPPLMGG